MRLESRKRFDIILKAFNCAASMTHSLHVFLERFSFRESVLDGAIEQCLGLCSLLALQFVEQPCLFLSFACLCQGHHGLASCIFLLRSGLLGVRSARSSFSLYRCLP